MAYIKNTKCIIVLTGRYDSTFLGFWVISWCSFFKWQSLLFIVSLIPKIWAPRSRRDQGEAKPSAELVSGQQGAAHGDVWLPGRRLSEAL